MAVDITPNQDGGVLKEVLVPGEGEDKPWSESIVRAHYHGTLTDGSVFDSSVERNQPFEFTLGKGQVIKAWDIGVATMKKNEKARFTCKSEYAYGASGSPPKIPGGATLIFEITLLSWSAEDISEAKDKSILRRIVVPGDTFGNPEEFYLCKIRLKGTHEGRVFDEREVSFNVGEGAEVGIPEGLETALQKMQKGEKSIFTLAPKVHWPDGNEALKIPSGATLSYEVEVLELERKEAWDMDAAEKIAEAKLLKERATNYFKADKLKLASKLYYKAMTYVDSEQGGGFSEEETVEKNKVLLAILLNLGLVHLKLKESYEAKTQLDKALEIDPDNVKGLFRRGQAQLSNVEPELALKDFEKVHKLEPNNTAAISQISACKAKLKEIRQREKQIYSNMFEKFARRDQENYRFGWWDDTQKQPVVAEFEPEDKEDMEEKKLERRKQLEHFRKIAAEKKKQKEEEERAKQAEVQPCADTEEVKLGDGESAEQKNDVKFDDSNISNEDTSTTPKA